MNRRDVSFPLLGLSAGIAATVFAQTGEKAPALASGVTKLAPAGSVIFYASNDLHGMRNAGDVPASYFVLRWTSPGKEGPKPGGSR